MQNKEKLNKYLKYLITAIGSSLILSIYTLVDSLCIGQYEGARGSAAVAVCMPVWTLIYSSGMLFAIGGATLMMAERGRGNHKKANEYFTISLVLALIWSLLLQLIFNVFNDEILRLFGAKNKDVLELTKKYTVYMRYALPFYLFTQYTSVVVRNDNGVYLVTFATLFGGVINMVLDVLFVFKLDMGISGAGLATMIGQIATTLVPCIHFFSKKNMLGLERVEGLFFKSKKVFVIGLSSFILDIAMGTTIIIYNNQIDRFASNEAELIALGAVYGAMCNCVVLIQGFGYAIGQSLEPLLSESLGEGNIDNIRLYKRYGFISAIVLGILSFALMELIPGLLLSLLADAKKGDLTMSLGIKIERIYFISFLFMGTNVVLIYFFNSVLKPKIAFILSILRGVGIPAIFLFTIPYINFDYIWLATVFTELIIYVSGIIISSKTKITLNALE